MAFYLNEFVPANVVTALIIDELRNKQQMRNLVRNSTPDTLGAGESYKVPGLGSITIGDYDGTDISTQNLSDASVTISVNQNKYFSFYADKVDTKQSAYDVLPLYVEKASYTLANQADIYLSKVIADNAGVTIPTVAIDESNVLDWVADIKEGLDNNNVPQAGRWLVIPPFAAAAIAKTNIETASTTDESARIEGYVQRYLGFDIYMSNNLDVPAVDTVSAIAGVPSAVDFVDCINEVEMQPSEKRFATQVKGLHVYGASVTQASAVAVSDITKA